MATVKKFLTRIDSIEGVEGSLIVKSDGHLLAYSVPKPANYASLMALSSKFARNIMDTSGFSFFRTMSFSHGNGEAFHIFPLLQYYLGVIQQPDAPAETIIHHVTHLLSHVKEPTSK